MPSFLMKFFPHYYNTVYNYNSDYYSEDRNSYCMFNDQLLQLFTSSLYLAGLAASFFAYWTTRNWGRRPSMLIGGSAFMTGAILNAAAQNIEMLILGRILLGVGIGFGNQVNLHTTITF